MERIDLGPQDLEKILEDSLREFHEREPKLPTDPVILERRLHQLGEDRVYQDLQERHDTAFGEERFRLGSQLGDYRWNVLTSPDPENIDTTR